LTSEILWTLPFAVSGFGFDLLGFEVAALVDEGDDEHLIAA
jgi:hypothetical protein